MLLFELKTSHKQVLFVPTLAIFWRCILSSVSLIIQYTSRLINAFVRKWFIRKKYSTAQKVQKVRTFIFSFSFVLTLPSIDYDHAHSQGTFGFDVSFL